jgi:predicted acyltransferase
MNLDHRTAMYDLLMLGLGLFLAGFVWMHVEWISATVVMLIGIALVLLACIRLYFNK